MVFVGGPPGWTFGRGHSFDSTWILAGWSADNEQYVSPNRPSANLLMYILESLLKDQDAGFDHYNFSDAQLDAVTMLPIMQALSSNDYSGTEWNATAAGLESRRRTASPAPTPRADVRLGLRPRVPELASRCRRRCGRVLGFSGAGRAWLRGSQEISHAYAAAGCCAEACAARRDCG